MTDLADLPAHLGRVAMVARWRPVHLGHLAVLDGFCARADTVFIGIGSANRYDLRNPFTASEVREMLARVLPQRPGLHVVEIPDLDDPPRWASMVRSMFGTLDVYVTANPWVAGVMAPHYDVVHPVQFVPPDRRVPIDGTMVRLELARGEPWQELVPASVAAYLVDNGLDARFKREFGLATLAAAVG